MHVLVTAASKHGATAEIAQFIADEIERSGIMVTVADPEEVRDIAPFDVVVLGSAVYTGYWLKPALRFVNQFEGALVRKRVWLFSSGPIGEPLEPPGEPFSVESVMEATAATEHVVFGGKIDRDKLGFGEKAIVVALRVDDGDYRPWDAIRSWARSIASELQTVPSDA